MLLHLLSDLHLEFGPMPKDYAAPRGTDVVILAGDIGSGIQGIKWAIETFDVPVIYVAGNHEFYGDNRYFVKGYCKMREAAEDTDVIVLQNEMAVIAGVRFIGTTLWTDMNLYGNQPLMMVQAQGMMRDYDLIMRNPPANMNWSNKPLLPIHVVREYEIAMEFLTDALNQKHDGPTVVMTHHAPSEQSCIPEFNHDTANPLYASNLERFVEAMEPELWVHGHIHQSKDYMIGNTRIAVNPRGYYDETTNVNFNLLLEV